MKNRKAGKSDGYENCLEFPAAQYLESCFIVFIQIYDTLK